MSSARDGEAAGHESARALGGRRSWWLGFPHQVVLVMTPWLYLWLLGRPDLVVGFSAGRHGQHLSTSSHRPWGLPRTHRRTLLGIRPLDGFVSTPLSCSIKVQADCGKINAFVFDSWTCTICASLHYVSWSLQKYQISALCVVLIKSGEGEFRTCVGRLLPDEIIFLQGKDYFSTSLVRVKLSSKMAPRSSELLNLKPVI